MASNSSVHTDSSSSKLSNSATESGLSTDLSRKRKIEEEDDESEESSLKTDGKSGEDDCGCRRRCIYLFTPEERRQLIENFEKLFDRQVQNSYLAGLMEVHEPGRKSRKSTGEEREDSSRKRMTTMYKIIVEGREQEVCMKAILVLHSISEKRLRRIRERLWASECVMDDKPNQYAPHSSYYPEEVISAARKHIRSLMESEYEKEKNLRNMKNKTSSKMPSESLTVAKMFQLFQKDHSDLKFSFDKYYKIYYDMLYTDSFISKPD